MRTAAIQPDTLNLTSLLSSLAGKFEAINPFLRKTLKHQNPSKGKTKNSQGGALEIGQRVANLFKYGTLQNDAEITAIANNTEIDKLSPTQKQFYIDQAAKKSGNDPLIMGQIKSQLGVDLSPSEKMALLNFQEQQVIAAAMRGDLNTLTSGLSDKLTNGITPTDGQMNDVVDNFRTDTREQTEAKIAALEKAGYDVSGLKIVVEVLRAKLTEERRQAAAGVQTPNTSASDRSTFDRIIEDIINVEGGYVNNPNDRGGPTNRGITLGLFQDGASRYLGIEPTLENLRNITPEQAKTLYKNMFWDKISGDNINDSQVAHIFMDMAVNSNHGPAIKTMQMTLNGMGFNLTVDGRMGPNTLNAINSANSETLFNNYKTARINFYQNLVNRTPTQRVFLQGWMNRINAFTYNN